MRRTPGRRPRSTFFRLGARVGDDHGPVLLVVEDLHWADASSRDLLRFVASRLRHERLLVVATYRSDDLHRGHPLRPLLGELPRLPVVERIDLEPFTEDELAGYLGLLTGAPVAPAAAAASTDDAAARARHAQRRALARQAQDEAAEIERAKGMLSKRKRKLFEKMQFSNSKRDEEARVLRDKRRKIEAVQGRR